ncbi:ABC transporter substrate-binding protein [Amycolatopsis sp. FDAARGOS 1241]|uniref:ABC transporter substrate-binding protein n=1 Tax=Amycolatopsis sp. FDAARGOS 1241 TaxID=2778070 RepID=UPI0019503058|nr:ABC transporter substrate-binding protein [Amycolatopsis sp. FDAARGOS 1241]QRP43910.1 ABC transporter substrate-binding protein [Amycolatopsis sp. FDAARGOS 1241]
MKGVEGTATIPRPPQRVVSAGQYRDADAAVALDVVPLITPDLDKFLPGGRVAVADGRSRGHSPELFADAQLPFERIAALKPDLILGTGVAQDCKTLSPIAPTLSSAAGYHKDTWQVTTRRVGTALGRSPEADRLVAGVEARIEPAKDPNPAFAGRTFTIEPGTGDGTVTTISSVTDAPPCSSRSSGSCCRRR